MTTATMDTPATSSTEATTRQVASMVVNSIAARNWDALYLSLAPDMVYWRPGTYDRLDGAEAYVNEWRRFAGGAANLRYRPHSVIVEGDRAVVEASADGHLPDGSEMSFSMVSIMRVANGRLAEEREYIVPRTAPAS